MKTYTTVCRANICHLLWFLFLCTCRCGLIIGHQRQPRPAIVHPDSWWQDIKRSGSSIRESRAPPGYAWIFHPTGQLVRSVLLRAFKKNVFYDTGNWSFQTNAWYMCYFMSVVVIQSNRLLNRNIPSDLMYSMSDCYVIHIILYCCWGYCPIC